MKAHDVPYETPKDLTPAFEYTPHTGDVGIRVCSATLEELFHHAAMGLVHTMVDPAELDGPVFERRCDADEDDLPMALNVWLTGFLSAGMAEGLFAHRIRVETVEKPGRVRSLFWARRFDPARQRLRTELKAVTFHGLKVQAVAGGWEAAVVFDI